MLFPVYYTFSLTFMRLSVIARVYNGEGEYLNVLYAVIYVPVNLTAVDCLDLTLLMIGPWLHNVGISI